MLDSDIHEFRVFNRFYTVFIGALNKNFMNSEYSLPQARVLQAIYVREGITPSEISTELMMDKSYLSRILINFEKKKVVTKKVSTQDGRVSHLYLTSAGRKDFAAIDAASDRQIENLLLQMSEQERKTVIKIMSQLRAALMKYKL